MFTSNYQGYRISVSPTERGNYQFSVTDPWGISSRVNDAILTGVSPHFIAGLNALPQADRQRNANEYLLKRFQAAGRFSVHVENVDSHLTIIFGDYGLKGGGRTWGRILSVAQVATGALLYGTGVGAIPGSALIGAGTNGARYAFSKKDGEYDDEEFLRQSWIGSVVGLATGGVGAIVGGGVVAGMAAGATGRVAGELADSIGNEDKKVKAGEVAKSALTGAMTGGAAGAAAKVVGGAASSVLTPQNQVLSRVGQVVVSSISGAAGSAAGNMVANVAQGKRGRSVFDGVPRSAAEGASIGAAIGAVQASARQNNMKGAERRVADAEVRVKEAESKNANFQREFNQKVVEYQRDLALGYKFKVDGERVYSAKRITEAYAEGGHKIKKYKDGYSETDECSWARLDIKAPQQLEAARAELATSQQQLSEDLANARSALGQLTDAVSSLGQLPNDNGTTKKVHVQRKLYVRYNVGWGNALFFSIFSGGTCVGKPTSMDIDGADEWHYTFPAKLADNDEYRFYIGAWDLGREVDNTDNLTAVECCYSESDTNTDSSSDTNEPQQQAPQNSDANEPQPTAQQPARQPPLELIDNPRFHVLQEVISHYTVGSHGRSAPMREIQQIMGGLRAGSIADKRGIMRIIRISEKMGDKHPILRAARRCI